LTAIYLSGMGLVALLGVAKKFFDTRESFHRSAKTKWEAKSAKLDYEERLRQVEAVLDLLCPNNDE
jgi:hypothetical protein